MDNERQQEGLGAVQAFLNMFRALVLSEERENVMKRYMLLAMTTAHFRYRYGKHYTCVLGIHSVDRALA